MLVDAFPEITLSTCRHVVRIHSHLQLSAVLGTVRASPHSQAARSAEEDDCKSSIPGRRRFAAIAGIASSRSDAMPNQPSRAYGRCRRLHADPTNAARMIRFTFLNRVLHGPTGIHQRRIPLNPRPSPRGRGLRRFPGMIIPAVRVANACRATKVAPTCWSMLSRKSPKCMWATTVSADSPAARPR